MTGPAWFDTFKTVKRGFCIQQVFQVLFVLCSPELVRFPVYQCSAETPSLRRVGSLARIGHLIQKDRRCEFQITNLLALDPPRQLSSC